MSDPVIASISTILISVFTVIVSQLVSAWVSKKKVPAEVEQLKAGSDLTRGELAEKYQTIASKQADANIELNQRLVNKESEKQELLDKIDKLQIDMIQLNHQYKQDMVSMDVRHKMEIEALKQDFLNCKMENERWVDWAKRLVNTLQAWQIEVPPFDIDEAKKQKIQTGELKFNRRLTDEKKELNSEDKNE